MENRLREIMEQQMYMKHLPMSRYGSPYVGSAMVGGAPVGGALSCWNKYRKLAKKTGITSKTGIRTGYKRYLKDRKCVPKSSKYPIGKKKRVVRRKKTAPKRKTVSKRKTTKKGLTPIQKNYYRLLREFKIAYPNIPVKDAPKRMTATLRKHGITPKEYKDTYF